MKDEQMKRGVIEDKIKEVNDAAEIIGAEVSKLRAEEKKLNEAVLNSDRAFEDKWKLLNEV